jgi:hypothetical protein
MTLKQRFMAVAFAVAVALPLAAKEVPQQWEVLDPSGVIEVKYAKPAPRLSTLDGKTIVLHWNSKNNGNLFLDRVAELLKEKAPKAKVIKLYEVDPSTNKIAGSLAESTRIANIIKDMKADLVIGSSAD